MKSHHYFQVYKVRLNSLLSCHYNDDYSEENADDHYALPGTYLLLLSLGLVHQKKSCPVIRHLGPTLMMICLN